MSDRLVVLLGLVLWALPAPALAQSAEVSGVVVDVRTERPLARADSARGNAGDGRG